MDLKKFYEIMQMSFMEGTVGEDISKDLPDYFAPYWEQLKEQIEGVVSRLQDGADLNEIQDFYMIESALKKPLAVSMSMNNLIFGVSEEDRTKFEEEIKNCITNFAINYDKLGKYLKGLNKDKEDKNVINEAPAEEEKEEEKTEKKEEKIEEKIEEKKEEKEEEQVEYVYKGAPWFRNVESFSDDSYEDDQEEPENEEPEKEEPVSRRANKNALDDMVKKLEGAKTTFNSGKYKDIITMVKFARDNEAWDGTENLDADQIYIVKLMAIKSRINKYINHKAADGVKQNSFKKLAAVEELNQLISTALDETAFGSFDYAGVTINKGDHDITFQQEYDTFIKKHGDYYDEECHPKLASDETLLQNYNEAKGKYNTSLQEMQNVDRCMCRIVVSSMSHKNIPDDRISENMGMKLTFLKHPSVEIKKDKVKEADAPNVPKA